MLDRAQFLISEGLNAFRRNGWMSFAAVSTVAVSLFLLGGLGYVYYRVQTYAETLPSRFDLRVFLKDEVTLPQLKDTALKIRKIDGVATAVWLPKDKEWDKWKKQYPKAIVEGMESPFPEAFKITLSDVSKADAVIANLKRMPTVMPQKGVQYDDVSQRMLKEILVFVRWLGFTLGGMLFFTAGILIYNAIRLTIDARRREIRTMQLVGASSATIRIPFMMEGLMHGLLGGGLATLLLASANLGFQSVLEQMSAIGQVPTFPWAVMLLVLCTFGAGYGLLCSAMALRSPMRTG